ncbi:lethal(2) giant larvae protein homolog 1 isoform X3 [Brienomyrus brachyistius]|uniref:lethal(2) giant larvae protein homolog 1 isoform X3 n=1 Tax=Brienomyrus brachyistius TaxID=42636 RepID=UPI0020B4143D|nr:lethal(2) giant larvae protein homolog 1 isoform X3 [Brienomyrus brachyistius]
MMKFRFKRQGNDTQREKAKQDVFAFNKQTVEHGFPSQPSALAYDPILRLMAIGTKSGAVKIYGSPGVEFGGRHVPGGAVTQMHFLLGQGRLLCLLDKNTLHLWEISPGDKGSSLDKTLSITLPGRPGVEGVRASRVTTLLPTRRCDLLCMGTEGGAVRTLALPSLAALEARMLLQDQVLQSVPDEYKCGRSLGPVESLQEHPRYPGKILIGYSRGLVVLWDLNTWQLDALFLGNQSLESLSWERSGRNFVSSHSNGSYVLWAVGGSRCPPVCRPMSCTRPYGPSPCKAISKILWRTSESGIPLVLFSGGMSRASYGDRHCLTVTQGDTQVALDFTSRIIDFFTVHHTEDGDRFDDPTALVVLLEEELIAFDLQTTGWPVIPSPYLASLHSSAITCSYHVSNVPRELWQRVAAAGRLQSPSQTAAKWPISGGNSFASAPKQKDLLLTGHEDGTVRFWDASGMSLTPLYKLSTASVFQTDGDHSNSSAQEEEWPPFRKVGLFDPYSDDPRLGVQKISLCKYSGRLVLAGTAGQVLVMCLNEEWSDHVISSSVIDLLQDRKGFTWKGHDQLDPKAGRIRFMPGFQPVVLVQCIPPASITTVALHAEWNLVAFGTSHGFGLFDYHFRCPVLARCTLHPMDTIAMEGPLSRIKSLKKSLHQSFRRIRKSRLCGQSRLLVQGLAGKESSKQLGEQGDSRDADVAPVQRRIEARSAEDSLSGVVRCLCFADTYLRDAAQHGPTLWAGTNAGCVFAYALKVPLRSGSWGGAVEAILSKEIQLTHRAPVVGVAVLDGQGNPLPEPYQASWDLATSLDVQASHSVLIASEEQIKVFSLPKITMKAKLKLTANEGCRIRKVALVSLAGSHALLCLTNLGDVQAFSVPGLRPQGRENCIHREDVSGMASCVFTKTGQGFYLISPSEFERFSLSKCQVSSSLCSVEVQRNSQTAVPSTPPWRSGTPSASSTGGPPSLGGQDGVRISPGFSCGDIVMDTTGDLTVEDVKDFLASVDEMENNLRNRSTNDWHSAGILINGTVWNVL